MSGGKVIEQGQWYVKLAEPKVWKRIAALAWEAYNGPIPAGMVLVSIDQDPLNCCDPTNYELLTRAELVALNHRSGIKYSDAPVSQRRTLIAMARVRAKLGKLKPAA